MKYKNNLKNFILVFILGLFVSCDCFQNGSGIIVDSETHKPITKVEIKEVGRDLIHYSDENGFFKISRITGGFCNCPDLKIIVAKENYINDTIVIENGDEKLVQMILNKNGH